MRKRRHPETLETYYLYLYKDLKDIPKQKNIDFALYFEEFLDRNDYRMLEVGCVIGNFLANDPENIIGIDINKNSLKIARKRCFNVICADAENGLCFKDESFDAIYASCVIEHLSNPIYFLKEIRRCLKPNGLLVLMTDDFAEQYRTSYDGPTYVSPLTKESLKRCAIEAGFRNFKIERRCVPTGMGLLVRKNIISLKTAIFFSKILYKVGIYKHKFGRGHITLIARKGEQ